MERLNILATVTNNGLRTRVGGVGLPQTLRLLPPARAWLEVDVAAIRHNVRALRRRLAAHASGAPIELWAVLKANGYGLGAVAAAEAAIEAGATGLCVATVDEAVALRAALPAIGMPILILGYFLPTPDDARRIVAYRLTPTITTVEQAHAVHNAARRAQRAAPVPIHLFVDTGLNREGLQPAPLLELAQTIVRDLPLLRISGLYSHFASADETEAGAQGGSGEAQRAVFVEARRMLREAGIVPEVEHFAASAAALRGGDIFVPHTNGTATRYAARTGIAIYGYYPSAESRDHATHSGDPLMPCLTVKVTIARIHDIEAGEGVSYGHTFIAARPTRLALLPIGYADGWRRAFGNDKTSVLINGHRAPVAGRVSMDQFVVDITDVPGVVREGDHAVLVGRQGEAKITLEEVAAAADTINYEILTGLGARLPRVYIGT